MIYFAAQVGQPDFVKIGYTSGVSAKRLAMLQTGSPLPLEIVAESEGDRKRESLLHTIFQEHRLQGEWFRVPAAEVCKVNSELDVERMEQMLSLRPKQFSRLSRLLGAATIKDTFAEGMRSTEFDRFIREAKSVPLPPPRKRGRPPKPADEKRSAVLYIKVTPAEKKLIDWAGGSEPTVWARGVLLRAAKRKTT